MIVEGIEEGLLKKSFDVSSKWFAFVISSCARRTWSLCNECASVILRPLLINGFPFNDSIKSFSIVVEFIVNVEDGGIVLLLRLVEEISEVE